MLNVQSSRELEGILQILHWTFCLPGTQGFTFFKSQISRSAWIRDCLIVIGTETQTLVPCPGITRHPLLPVEVTGKHCRNLSVLCECETPCYSQGWRKISYLRGGLSESKWWHCFARSFPAPPANPTPFKVSTWGLCTVTIRADSKAWGGVKGLAKGRDM